MDIIDKKILSENSDIERNEISKLVNLSVP